MQATNLTETMSVKDLQAVEVALNAVREKLPSLVTLTRQERAQMPPPRHQQLVVMELALATARENPTLIPGNVDLTRFEQEVRLVLQLDKCCTQLERITAEVRDTLCVVASDTLKATAEVRAHVLAASKRAPALEGLARRLTLRRPRSRRPAAGNPPATGAPTPAPTAAPDPAPSAATTAGSESTSPQRAA